MLLFNKPFHVLTQFTSTDGKATFKDFLSAPGMRPAGRLDYDSEGLVLLTDSGSLQTRLADPRWKLGKTYYVQVEGEIDRRRASRKLRRGVAAERRHARCPPRPSRVDEPAMAVAARSADSLSQGDPDSWLQLTIREGRNRQVRRMTAAVGLPDAAIDSMVGRTVDAGGTRARAIACKCQPQR